MKKTSGTPGRPPADPPLAPSADSTSSTATFLELHAGDLRLALRPDLGGCIAGLWHAGTQVLRSTEPAGLVSSRKSGAYPLVPYSNRLGFRKFRWQGHDYTTQPNFDDSPHSLHGVAWLRPWRTVSSSPLEAVIELTHAGDAAWPFAFEVTQSFSLTPGAMRVQMVVTNRAPAAQPVGMGWHPYFTKRERSHLAIEVSDRWDSDASELPLRRVAQPGIEGAVSGFEYDNCFDGWNGPARIRDETFSSQLTSSLNHLVVFTPHDRPYFCVEPVSHVSNAIQMADPAARGLRTLQPGESCEAWMQLEVSLL